MKWKDLFKNTGLTTALIMSMVNAWFLHSEKKVESNAREEQRVIEQKTLEAPAVATRAPEPLSPAKGGDCSASFGDGRGGTLWKQSEHKDNYVFLLPSSCRVEKVYLCADYCVEGVYTGLANPEHDGTLRQHFRFYGTRRALNKKIGKTRKNNAYLEFEGRSLLLEGGLKSRID